MHSTVRTAALRTTALTSLATCALAGSIALTLPARAQDAAGAGAAVVVPAMTCEKPGALPLDRASPDMGRFQKRMDAYQGCVNEYARAQAAKANAYAAQSRAYGEAANKTIDDFNAYVADLNERTKGDKSGTAKNTKD